MRDVYSFVKAVISAVGKNKNDQDLGKEIRRIVLYSDEYFEVTEEKED